MAASRLAALSAAALVLAGCSSTAGTGSGSPAAPMTTNRNTPSTSWTTSAGTAPTRSPATAVPRGFRPESVTFVSSADGWALGASCGGRSCPAAIARTSDGGSSWSPAGAPPVDLGGEQGVPADNVAILRFATTTTGWAAGGGIWSTRDGGTTWSHDDAAPTAEIDSLETGGGFVYAATVDCSGAQGCLTQVWASPIAADHWTAVSNAVRPGLGGLAVHGSAWFLPTAGAVLHGSGTARATSLPDPCGADGGGLGLAIADAQHLDGSCAADGAMGSETYQLYGTIDGGHTWTKAGTSHRENSGFGGIADNGAGALVLAAASGDSELLRTTDDGATFAKVEVLTESGGISWRDLGFTTATQGVVILARTALYVTRDAGATWSKVSF